MIYIFCKAKCSFLIGCFLLNGYDKKIQHVEIIDSSKGRTQDQWKRLEYETVIGVTKPQEEEFQVG